ERATTHDVARSMRDGAHDVLSMEDPGARWRQAMLAVAEDQKVWLQLYGGRPLSADDVLAADRATMEKTERELDSLRAGRSFNGAVFGLGGLICFTRIYVRRPQS
ncbi:MAG: hypothetical protein WCP53_10150, partial [Verrucomicrobiota bacterium]